MCKRGARKEGERAKQKKSMQINNYFIDHSIQRHLQRFDWIDEQKKAEIDEGRRQVKAREEQTQIDTQRERDTDTREVRANKTQCIALTC